MLFLLIEFPQTQKLPTLYFTSFYLDKPVFPSIAKMLLNQFKNLKNNQSSTRELLQYRKSCFKISTLDPFLKTAAYTKKLKLLEINR